MQSDCHNPPLSKEPQSFSSFQPNVNYIMSGIMFETPGMVRKSMLGISRRMGIVSGKPVSTPE
jgi:hypothetical protein